MHLISIIVPCYNEQDTIPIFYEKLKSTLNTMKEKIKFEVIFVDDGSTDTTLTVIKSLSIDDDNTKYISFSKNFGKEAAIYAGLERSTGDFVAIMDADLQDPPELLAEMYNEIVNYGYDCIVARRVSRCGEPVIRSFFARKFYYLMNIVSKTEIMDGTRDYRLATRQVVNAVLSLKEVNRFSKGIFNWVGFKSKYIEYENVERIAGETKWSIWKLFLYSFNSIIAFSTLPLAIASVLGIILCFVAFILICVIVLKTLIFKDPVAGYPSLICAIIFIGGIQLFCIGVLGQYLAKTYLESKNRPLYIVKEEKDMN